MSSKHLRRLLEEREKNDGVDYLADEELEQIPTLQSGPSNRFAFFDNDDDSGGDDDVESQESLVASKSPVKNDKRKKKTNKKKKKEKGEGDIDDEKLLEKLVKENQAFDMDSVGLEIVEMAQLFKPDPRLFDASAELKKALGKAFKESSSQLNSSHRQLRGAGRIVKQKQTWPPLRSIGLSMELDHEDGNIKWFRFVHNGHYEKLERMSWLATDSHDHALVNDILHDNNYHLNSLLLLANILRMQEDITHAGDCIERGIFYCEQSFHATFHATSWNHRIDYLDYENRAFFLLLHRHMLNVINKRCFETALNFGKLIFTMDPQRDPLAVMLIIDTVAIKAKQYTWLKTLYQTAKDWKNLDLLPNFRYSIALVHFMEAKSDDDWKCADDLLSSAICSFPGVVTQLWEELQIQPDRIVESNQYLSIFGFNKESDGLKLIIKIFVKQAAELWKVPDTLAWLERVTRECVQKSNCIDEMEQWRLTRQRVFVGVPPNIRRLAILLDLESSSSGVTDPSPPSNGRSRYIRGITDDNRPDSFLSGFIHSILPEYNSNEHLLDLVNRMTGQLQDAFAFFGNTLEDVNVDEQDGNPQPTDGNEQT